MPPKTKPSAFAAALDKKKTSEPPIAPPVAAEAVPAAPSRPKPANKPQAAPKPSTRTGTKIISGHFDESVSRLLKQIGLDEGERTTQDMLGEALDMFFQSRGKPTIAKRPRDKSK